MREVPIEDVRTLFWDILDDLAADLGSESDTSPEWTPPPEDSQSSESDFDL